MLQRCAQGFDRSLQAMLQRHYPAGLMAELADACHNAIQVSRALGRLLLLLLLQACAPLLPPVPACAADAHCLP